MCEIKFSVEMISLAVFFFFCFAEIQVVEGFIIAIAMSFSVFIGVPTD